VFDELGFRFAQLHPNSGAKYTSDVLLIPDAQPRASSDLPHDNTPANACSMLANH
jgi:hypothetical protein